MTSHRATHPPAVKRSGGLSAEEVRAQLERILGDRDFEGSTRIREFLKFVVEEALAGRGVRLNLGDDPAGLPRHHAPKTHL